MTDTLDAARITGLLARLLDGSSLAPGLWPAVAVVAETGSTNADLREQAATLQAPLLLAAEKQTAGRGRAGRSWLSEPGDSLCFSLAWPFSAPLHRLSGLSLAVGVALAEALRAPRIDGPDSTNSTNSSDSRPGTPVMLKWPNDLLVDGAKLGGILIETAGATAQHGLWAVIGIGLNVRANQDRDAAIGQPAAALCAAADGQHDKRDLHDIHDIHDIDRNALLAQLLASLCIALATFDREGLAPFVARWDALHAHAGCAVSIIEQGRTLHEGIAIGIDDSGCLQLDTGNGIVKIAAGDVSLRVSVPQHAASGSAHAVH